MKKIIVLILLIFSVQGFAQINGNILKKVDYEELKSIIQNEDGKLYVVNFWATWCKPCIEELPSFMTVNDLYKDNPEYQMILVSLDHPRLLDTKVRKFIEKNKLDADVYLLDDKRDIMELLPLFDETWNGAIPSTFFYKNGKKLKFRPMQINRYELEDYILEYLEL